MTLLAEIQAINALRKAPAGKEREKFAKMIFALRAVETADAKSQFPLSEREIKIISIKALCRVKKEEIDAIIAEVIPKCL